MGDTGAESIGSVLTGDIRADRRLSHVGAISHPPHGRKVLCFLYSTRRVPRRHMQRREFITLVCGVAVAWPRAVRAAAPARRIGVLMNGAPDDAEVQVRLAAFLDGLQQLGWTDGRNVRIDTRWASDVGANRGAEELVALGPDVILASASLSVAALQRITRSVPIVFANVVDPVGAGFVASLARPGGNTTGFSAFEYSLSGKWLELLKEIAPSVTRVAVLRDPALAAGIGQFAAIQALAPRITRGGIDSN